MAKRCIHNAYLRTTDNRCAGCGMPLLKCQFEGCNLVTENPAIAFCDDHLTPTETIEMKCARLIAEKHKLIMQIIEIRSVWDLPDSVKERCDKVIKENLK